MNKKILIISTSPRKGGNSELLADSFAKGAVSVGNEVEKICLYDKTIGFCKGCLACQKTQRCVIHDDADTIAQKMKDVDVIVFATPIYYYEMCGQMKTMLDRANPLYPSDYKFRDIYLLATAAEEETWAVDGAINGLGGWIKCFDKAELKGVVKGLGATFVGDIEGNLAINEAFKMGSAIN
jgi:multimeric flavodoxin WrbA